uniref:FH2 domain-containing protein n=1 Tax=Strongyloides stercoralis TaxID=6248 RepID=A0A913HUN6_STRER
MTEYNSWNGNRYMNKNNHLKMRLGTSVVSDIPSNSPSITSSTLTPWKCYSIDIDCDGPPLSNGPLKSIHDDYTTSTLPSRGSNRKKNIVSKTFQTKAATVEEHKNDSITNYLRDKVGISSSGRNFHESLNIKPINLISRDKLMNGNNGNIKNEKNSIVSKINNIIPLNGLQKKISSPKKQWFSTSIDEIEGNSYLNNQPSTKPFTLDSVSQYIDDEIIPESNESNIINSNDKVKKNFLEFSTTKTSYKEIYENKKNNFIWHNEINNNNIDKYNNKEINKNINEYKINEEDILKKHKSIDEIKEMGGGIKNLIKEYSQKQDDVNKCSMVNEKLPFTIKRLSNNKNISNNIKKNNIISDTPSLSTITTINPYSEISTTTTFEKKNLINDCNNNNNNTISSIRTETTFGKFLPSNEDDTLMSIDDAYNILGLTRKSSLVVRTQTSLRVKIMIEKLLYSSGRDQRRALFALKKVFQDDKDLVPEFVQSEGLDSLIKLGRLSDQNHQNYILRALGQIMLYVDGMNGIIAHNDTIKWFYELLDSPLLNEEERREMSPLRLEWYRLVVKTALKLLLVFVEYTDSNSLLLLAAVTAIDRENNRQPWFSIMRILRERNATDEETLVYGMTVINKTLDGIPDQDTYYDIVDSLEVQGIEECLKALSCVGNKELQDQVALYEKVLRQEDAANDESDSSDGLMVKMRHSQINNGNYDRSSFRKDKHAINNNGINVEKESKRFSENISKFENEAQKLMKGDWVKDDKKDNDKNITSKNNYIMKNNYEKNDIIKNGITTINNNNINNNNIDGKENCINDRIKNEVKNEESSIVMEEEDEPKVKAPPPSFPSILFSPTEKVSMEFPDVIETKKEEPVIKPMMKTKLENDEEDGVSNNFAAQLRKRAQMREENSNRNGLFENKQSESEINWKKAAENLKSKPLIINDLDFSEFHDDQFEQDPLVLARMAQNNMRNENMLSGGPPPPPPPGIMKGIPPAPPNIPPPLSFGKKDGRESSPPSSSKAALVKMHWKEVVAEPPPVPTLKNKGTFWKKVETPQIDTSKLAKLFEMKQEKQILKKANGEAKPQVLQVLSMKRSQAINIGLTKLPPINAIPAAIMKFDSLVLNKEGIEKILQTMMPTAAEIEMIQTKMIENPDMPLGHAEQFLLKLYQIPCLLERLKLWLFTLDYKNCEKDIAEPLMDLQLAMKEIEYSKTFRTAMGMLLTIGNALNGTEIQGFQLDYLTKASEVKDPVYKHTLTYHLAEYMIDTYSDGTDLYSEFGAVARSARIDYEELHENLKKLEQDCKASWDYLNKISQKDSTHSMKQKIDEYLNDVAKRIHQLKNIYRLTINRWHAFLLFFGYTVQDIPNQKPMAVCKMVIEFALEYRTTRDKILQQRKRLADKRERNKTRGKMWVLEKQNNQENSSNTGRRRQFIQNDSDRHDEMAKMLTGGDDSLNRRRIRPTPERTAEQTIIAKREALRSTPGPNGGEINDGDDEILDGLVKAATIQSEPRDNRRKARQFNRKSLRRTRTLKLVDDQLGSVLNNY